MKFIVPSQILSKNLQLVSGIISTGSPVPITECVLFELKDKQLTLTATDLETTMVTSLEVSDADGDINIAIPAKILLDTLKELSDVPVNFEIEENLSIEITAEDANFRLVGAPADEFPEKPTMEEKEGSVSFEVDAKILSNGINKTIFAAAQQDIRPVMSGVYCLVQPESLTFVATDAHRLVRFVDKTTQTGIDASFILPKKPLSLLKNYFSSVDDKVKISYDGTKMVGFTYDKLQVITKLIEGKYPNYEAVIPRENHNILKVERLLFMKKMRTILPYGNYDKHSSRSMGMQIKSDVLQLTAQDDFDHKAEITMPCIFEGQFNAPQKETQDGDAGFDASAETAEDTVFKIGFDPKFLQDMLGVLDTEEVILELKDANTAGLIYPLADGERDDQILMLLMPVMI
ncbi:MAG: DNA polymerase III subunit beta [Bacteroidales bacterium]|jgi:DNA polymerase-3 subunit beta|nr:DNA polymerase III subunit beta [Bacteroidales bacterium]